MRNSRGFTLVELIMVMVITGIIAATLTIFLKPAIDSYVDTKRRSDLTELADIAVRRMATDVRRAVPNSIELQSSTCFRLVPTTTGGRYRMAPDTTAASSWLDPTEATTSFDVLSPMSAVPAAGDWVVIGNQAAADVYAGGNRAAIDSVDGASAVRRHRIVLSGAKQFPAGYDGGRFVVVADAEQSVFYSCVGTALYRTVAGFAADPAATCASTAGAQVASDLAACSFVYDPNQGATQQNGFLWLRLTLSRSGESLNLVHGVHVDNAP